MMKQASKPILPPVSAEFKNTNDVSEKELIYQLESTANDALLLLPAKKGFLISAMKNKDDLMAKSELFDAVFNSSLKAAISRTIPEKLRVISRGSNRALAEIIAASFRPLLMLHQHINQQVTEELGKVSHLRPSTSNKRNKPSELMTFLEEAHQLFLKLEARIHQHRSNPSKDTVARPVKLTPSQVERLWSKERVPVPLTHQYCVLCGHKTTNLPQKNDLIEKQNEKIENLYQKNLSEWEEYKLKVAKGETVAKPKGLKRRPILKGLKEPIIMCMCATSHCLGQFDQSNLRCPIKCLKCSDSSNSLGDTCSLSDGVEKKFERYEFTGVPRKKCTCPVCNCKCSYACFVADIPKIILARKNDEVEAMYSNQNPDATDIDTTTPSFLRNIMGDAIKVGYLNMQQNYERKRLEEPFVTATDDDMIMRRASSLACQHAAVSIVSSQQKLSLADRKLWRDGFGAPSTVCTLPSGDTFDTRNIYTDNKHSQNNRLGAVDLYLLLATFQPTSWRLHH